MIAISVVGMLQIKLRPLKYMSQNVARLLVAIEFTGKVSGRVSLLVLRHDPLFRPIDN